MTILKKRSKVTVIISMLLIVLLLICSCEKQESKSRLKVRDGIKILEPTEEDFEDLKATLVDYRYTLYKREHTHINDDMFLAVRTDFGDLGVGLQHNGEEIKKYITRPLSEVRSTNANGDTYSTYAWIDFVYNEEDPLHIICDEFVGSDERKGFVTSKYAYWKVPEDYLYWLIEDVFNGTIDKSVKRYASDNILYYYDGYFYNSTYAPIHEVVIISVNDVEVINISAFENVENLYEIRYRFKYYDAESGYEKVEPEINFAVVALKENENGFKFWSFYGYGQLNNSSEKIRVGVEFEE